MRKIIICLTSMLLSLQMSAAYYVAGNGTAGNPWCDGKSWVINGSPMTDQGNGVWSVTFSNVPVGNYQFKVTDGSNWYGGSKFSKSCSNITCTAPDNIVFMLQKAQDLTITYNGSKICLQGSEGEEPIDSSQIGAVGVPSEYEGVMLQAFYWDSYKLTTFSRTKYIDLLGNFVDDMGTNFDLVWMPPSGNGSGVGYYTKCYSNLDSDWGQKSKLQELLTKLHNHGCKVLADVVINHHASSNGWAKGFAVNNFSPYGTYQISSKYICSGDECFTDSSSDSKNLEKGGADTGTNDGGCRDLDHSNTYVQEMCKAYTKWLINTIGFDGFRYDMTLGYAGQYLSMYNLASQPFFSVSEHWESLSIIQGHLQAANYNTLAFDFPLKYKFNTWAGGSAYANLKNPSLRLKGLSKYAVNFIDNHDTFRRSNGQEFLGDNTNLSTKKRQIVEANAYLLMMPGVPCVFWPHWYTFKDEINQLIAIRKQVGIHSESEVTDESAGSNKYTATIHGHRGTAILRMGSSRDMTLPDGYTHTLAGDNFDIYTMQGTGVEHTTVTPAATKIIDNGTMYILRDGKRYTTDGRMAE